MLLLILYPCLCASPTGQSLRPSRRCLFAQYVCSHPSVIAAYHPTNLRGISYLSGSLVSNHA
jgi:hypothetical protein